MPPKHVVSTTRMWQDFAVQHFLTLSVRFLGSKTTKCPFTSHGTLPYRTSLRFPLFSTQNSPNFFYANIVVGDFNDRTDEKPCCIAMMEQVNDDSIAQVAIRIALNLVFLSLFTCFRERGLFGSSRKNTRILFNWRSAIGNSE